MIVIGILMTKKLKSLIAEKAFLATVEVVFVTILGCVLVNDDLTFGLRGLRFVAIKILNESFQMVFKAVCLLSVA